MGVSGNESQTRGQDITLFYQCSEGFVITEPTRELLVPLVNKGLSLAPHPALCAERGYVLLFLRAALGVANSLFQQTFSNAGSPCTPHMVAASCEKGNSSQREDPGGQIHV